jgi:hypothetical protein
MLEDENVRLQLQVERLSKRVAELEAQAIACATAEQQHAARERRERDQQGWILHGGRFVSMDEARGIGFAPRERS